MRTFCFILLIIAAAQGSFAQTANGQVFPAAASFHPEGFKVQVANFVVYSGCTLLGSAAARNLNARHPQLWGIAFSASVMVIANVAFNHPEPENIAAGIAGITVAIPIEKILIKKSNKHGLTH